MESALFAEAARLNRAGDPRPLLAWQAHLRAVTEAALLRKAEPAANLSNALGYYLWMSGDYAGARPYLERALVIVEKVLGPEHPNMRVVRGNLAALRRMKDESGGRAQGAG